MIVYHGSTTDVPIPDLNHSKKYLDFGKGFYLTTYRQQAEKWAIRKAVRTQKSAILNVYEIPDSWDGINVLHFEELDDQWLDFVFSCRRGDDCYKSYDVIIGSVADDDVFKTIDMYFRGIWDKERVLRELKFFQKNDQICITSIEALSRVKFLEAVKLEV